MRNGAENVRTVFTVGHSNYPFEVFAGLLLKQGVTLVADVRSQPFSRFAPQYNREALKKNLERHHIRYAFLGRELGARREEPECYVDGAARYDLIATLARFGEGMAELRRLAAEECVALVCRERDPLECHRAILVGRHLRGPGLRVAHILADGSVEANEDMETRLLEVAGVPRENLFEERALLVEQAYERRGDVIAYRVKGVGK